MTAPSREPTEAMRPCPFCGGEATIEITEGSMGQRRFTVGCNDAGAEAEKAENGMIVLCYGYQSLTTFGTKAEAIAAWNRRALAEQDTAARREGFEQARERAARTAEEAPSNINSHWEWDAPTPGEIARAIRALTPEPPSEKEPERG